MLAEVMEWLTWLNIAECILRGLLGPRGLSGGLSLSGQRVRKVNFKVVVVVLCICMYTRISQHVITYMH